ncbi:MULTISPECIES: hypothetical protein [unclassified Erythrobacter]|uniref:hypothetical protein n=1 Tax=unclassified Erythrobacter TaxID=2633097 RepID=UPI0012EE18BD|nr:MULTISPECIES: hypothetical protein [unclassified Erythrobacter]MBO6767281.1 hypothetical protein [Erythrobacter sp.]
MPQASPSLPPQEPALLEEDEANFIRETIKRFYGDDAVIRNYGPNPDRLELHVEANVGRDMRLYDCLGVLFTRIERPSISLEVTKRGSKVHGPSKIAYRQGVIV